VDGRKWRLVESPDVGYGSSLFDVGALSATDAWAVGDYVDAPPRGRAYPLAEHWNGASWTVVPAPTTRYYAGLHSVAAIAGNDVWAVGTSSGRSSDDTTLVEHWDGSSWSIVTSPNPGKGGADLLDVTATPNSSRVWAVGEYQPLFGGQFDPLIERWDGSRWRVYRPPAPEDGGYLSGVTALADDDVWAVGQTGLHSDQPLTLHWDGTSWSIVPVAPAQYGYFSAVAAISAADVWAVGESFGDPLVEHWNGHDWTIVPTPPGKSTDFHDVVAENATSLWTVGVYVPKHGSRTVIEHWNGARWSFVDSPEGALPLSSLDGVTTVAGTKDLWAVGETFSLGGKQETLIELYS
jgi:hypothetical protein